MLNTRTWYLMTTLLLGLVAIKPSDSEGKSAAALPSPASAQDYWSASKRSLERASEHKRLSETQAACKALVQSLDYYRMALAKDNPLAWELTSTRGDEGDGMQEIRSSFGCTSTQLG